MERLALEHGPQKMEKRIKPITRYPLRYRSDRASEKIEAGQYLKEGERLHVIKQRGKWVRNRFLSFPFRKRTV